MSRGLCFSGLSSHLHGGNGRGLSPIPHWQPFPLASPHSLPLDPSLSPLVAFGCEASVAAPPCPRSALLLSSLLFLPLSLTTPISASSFLLGSRFLLSPLCLWTPAPARPGSHSDGCKGTLPPPHSHPGPGDPTLWGAPLPLSPSPPHGTISVEVPWALGLCHLSPSDMTLCDSGQAPAPFGLSFPCRQVGCRGRPVAFSRGAP